MTTPSSCKFTFSISGCNTPGTSVMQPLFFSSSAHSQVAQAKTGGEASRAAGSSGAIPQVGAGGATCATHEGPAVHRQRNQAIQVHRTVGIPLLNQRTRVEISFCVLIMTKDRTTLTFRFRRGYNRVCSCASLKPGYTHAFCLNSGVMRWTDSLLHVNVFTLCSGRCT